VPLAAVASIVLLLTGFDRQVYIVGGILMVAICLAYAVRRIMR
jgi:hypothetical protein